MGIKIYYILELESTDIVSYASNDERRMYSINSFNKMTLVGSLNLVGPPSSPLMA